MLQKVTPLDSVPTAEETVLTTEVPTKESRLYTLLNYTEQSLRLRGGTRELEDELGDNLDSIAGLRATKAQNISTQL